jgi:uncharacterized protein (TIGR00369 family)
MNKDASALASMMPFAATCGVEIEEATSTMVHGRMAWAPERCTAGGVMHGGALMTLADSVGAICAFLNLPEGATTATVESKTNFFRAVRSGSVVATAQPLHVGRTLITVQTAIRDDHDRLVAQTTQTQAVLAAASKE